jgi:hypothetical protein
MLKSPAPEQLDDLVDHRKEVHHGFSTCTSAASTWGSQRVIAIDRYSAMAAGLERAHAQRYSPGRLRPGWSDPVFWDAYRETGLNFTRVHSGVTSSKMTSSGMSTLTASISHCTTLETIRGPSSSCTTA